MSKSLSSQLEKQDGSLFLAQPSATLLNVVQVADFTTFTQNIVDSKTYYSGDQIQFMITLVKAAGTDTMLSAKIYEDFTNIVNVTVGTGAAASNGYIVTFPDTTTKTGQFATNQALISDIDIPAGTTTIQITGTVI